MSNMFSQLPRRLNFAKKSRVILPSLVVGASLALAFLLPVQTAQADNDHRQEFQSLVGAWVMQVGTPPGPTFTALETFSAGGGSVESNNGPGGRGPGSGHGSWVRTGHRQFLSTLVRLNYDSDGNFTGTTKVRRSITLNRNGDEFTGRDNVDLFDPAGNLIPVTIPPGTFHGTRIEAERLIR